LSIRRLCILAPAAALVASQFICLQAEQQEREARAMARRLYAEGKSLRGIATELERLGIRSRTGRGFAPVQVKRMVA
jgi:hypothetical protein